MAALVQIGVDRNGWLGEAEPVRQDGTGKELNHSAGEQS